MSKYTATYIKKYRDQGPSSGLLCEFLFALGMEDEAILLRNFYSKILHFSHANEDRYSLPLYRFPLSFEERSTLQESGFVAKLQHKWPSSLEKTQVDLINSARGFKHKPTYTALEKSILGIAQNLQATPYTSEEIETQTTARKDYIDTLYAQTDIKIIADALQTVLGCFQKYYDNADNQQHTSLKDKYIQIVKALKSARDEKQHAEEMRDAELTNTPTKQNPSSSATGDSVVVGKAAKFLGEDTIPLQSTSSSTPRPKLSPRERHHLYTIATIDEKIAELIRQTTLFTTDTRETITIYASAACDLLRALDTPQDLDLMGDLGTAIKAYKESFTAALTATATHNGPNR